MRWPSHRRRRHSIGPATTPGVDGEAVGLGVLSGDGKGWRSPIRASIRTSPSPPGAWLSEGLAVGRAVALPGFGVDFGPGPGVARVGFGVAFGGFGVAFGVGLGVGGTVTTTGDGPTWVSSQTVPPVRAWKT